MSSVTLKTVATAAVGGFGGITLAPEVVSYLGKPLSVILGGNVKPAIPSNATTAFALAAAPITLAVLVHDVVQKAINNQTSRLHNAPEAIKKAIVVTVDVVTFIAAASIVGVATATDIPTSLLLGFSGTAAYLTIKIAIKAFAPEAAPAAAGTAKPAESAKAAEVPADIAQQLKDLRVAISGKADKTSSTGPATGSLAILQTEITKLKTQFTALSQKVETHVAAIPADLSGRVDALDEKTTNHVSVITELSTNFSVLQGAVGTITSQLTTFFGTAGAQNPEGSIKLQKALTDVHNTVKALDQPKRKSLFAGLFSKKEQVVVTEETVVTTEGTPAPAAPAETRKQKKLREKAEKDKTAASPKGAADTTTETVVATLEVTATTPLNRSKSSGNVAVPPDTDPVVPADNT